MAPVTPLAESLAVEDRALQEAIQESLKARSANMETQFGDDLGLSSTVESEQYAPRRFSIEDRIKDLALRAATQLPLVSDPHADTWVFIDPPEKQPEQDQDDYREYVKRYQAPIPMRRETLERCSPFFVKAFGPTAQFRIKRQRKLTKAVDDDPRIKYVLDLTPPSEGEEAVYLTTELCCSEGVRLWYQASKIWKVSKILVGGEEEYTSVRLQKGAVSEPSMLERRASDENLPVNASILGAYKDTTTRMTLEYSPVRHRSAIERVLSALQGSDPQLDSAPKVWTAFAVAKYLEIKHSELDSYIIRWLRADPNSYFLEVLPEVSLQIADGLENYDLARDSFAILVGEEALDNLRRARKPDISNKRSSYGRKREELPEAIFTRVEYASKNFLERIIEEFKYFIDGMEWLEGLAEFRRLSSYIQPDLQDTVHALKKLLKDYIRGAVYKLLCVNYDSVPSADLHHHGGEDLLPRVSRSDVWTDLSLNERILTRTFWRALVSFKMFDGSTNMDIREGWDMRWNSIGLSAFEQRELDQGTYREVKNKTLVALVRAGERRVAYNETGDDCSVSPDEPQLVSTLPMRNRHQVHFTSVPSIASRSEPMQAEDAHHEGQILARDQSVESTHPIDDPRLFECQRDSKDPIIRFPTIYSPFFDLSTFFSQAQGYINAFAREKLQYPDQSAREGPHAIGITNTLTCLQDSEWKYLPLWAGGNDDGSGGVYIEQPPTADLGFSTPGPEVHTGDTPAASTLSPSEADFEMVDGQTTDASTNTSMANNRSFADHIHRNRVYAADSADMSSHHSGAPSDYFTMVTEDVEEEIARNQIEAQERSEAAEEHAEKEARRIEKAKEMMIDENYADLFIDDDDMMDDDDDDTDRAESGDLREFEDDDDHGDLILV
ncbi:hypothetical protein N7G274_003102 [Stereocaulon virgatum]|uniref:Uncharacterized protein n=1 Tax=Stereocaulon virgatum TaxID=373712 RepID=A0ABR4AEZ2_9LECA